HEIGRPLRTVPYPWDPAGPLRSIAMNARDLLPGERILVSSCRHWVVLLRPIATTILAALVLLVILTLLPLAGELRLFLMLGVALAGVLIINLYYWGWRSHEYVLTDQRVILNQGIISKFSRSITIDFRNGMTIEWEGGLWIVVEFQQGQNARGDTFFRTKLRNVRTGAIIDQKFRDKDRFARARIEKVAMQYLYSDGDRHFFMDLE